MEIWKDINGYEGLYQISNFGRVKSLERKHNWGGSIYNVSEKILKQTTILYCRVGLTKNKKMKNWLVHRLVADAFVPNPNKYPIVMHKDDNPKNNNYTNLSWGTKYLNSQDMKNKGRARNQYSINDRF